MLCCCLLLLRALTFSLLFVLLACLLFFFLLLVELVFFIFYAFSVSGQFILGSGANVAFFLHQIFGQLLVFLCLVRDGLLRLGFDRLVACNRRSRVGHGFYPLLLLLWLWRLRFWIRRLLRSWISHIFSVFFGVKLWMISSPGFLLASNASWGIKESER